VSIETSASRERIFAFLTDPDLVPKWTNGTITTEQLSPEKERVGSRSRTTIKSDIYKRVIEQEIVNMEPSRLLETRCRCWVTNQGRELPPFSYQQRYEIEDHGDRRTLTWTSWMRGFWGFFSRFASFAFGVDDDQNRTDLERLKEAVEADRR